MISEQNIEKSKKIDLARNLINLGFNTAVLNGDYDKIKDLIENSYNDIFLANMNYSIFRSCLQNYVKIFEYLMFKQNKFNFNTDEYWNEALINSCNDAGTTQMLEFILKSPLRNTTFSKDTLYAAFLNTNLYSLKILIKHNKINIHEFIYKNDSKYLMKLVQSSSKDVIEYLSSQYEINFGSFKHMALIRAGKSQSDANKVLKIINKQELFFNLKENLADIDNEIKKNKI